MNKINELVNVLDAGRSSQFGMSRSVRRTELKGICEVSLTSPPGYTGSIFLVSKLVKKKITKKEIRSTRHNHK